MHRGPSSIRRLPLWSLSSSVVTFTCASATAIWAATRALFSSSARFARRLASPVSSLMRASRNGVSALPRIPWSSASPSAWSMAASICSRGSSSASRHGHRHQHAAGQAQAALRPEQRRNLLRRIGPHVHPQAAVAIVERRETVRPIPHHRHAVRLQPLQRRRQIQDRLGPRAHDEHRRLRQLGQVRRNVNWQEIRVSG